MGLGSKSVALATFAVASFTGCGSDPRLRVDGSVLEKITVENRLLLFDAENELDIALDAKDQVLDELERLERAHSRTKQVVEETEREAEKLRGQDDRARITELRTLVEKARLAHIEAKQNSAKVQLRRQDKALVLALARFELAKARLVKQNNVPGAADLKIEDFEKQVEDYRTQLEDTNPELEEAEARVEEQEEAWSLAASQLREESGGAFGSRWLD